MKTQAAALPLVGNVAPDFKATAVFDQEFVDVTLSQYKVRSGEEETCLYRE